MATVVKKPSLTPAQTKLLKILQECNGQKTIAEIAPLYQRAMGKTEGEKGSVTTAISVLRKAVKAAGYKFPANLEPKRASGGGRSSERVDVADALNSLGLDFEELEPAEGDESPENEAGDES